MSFSASQTASPSFSSTANGGEYENDDETDDGEDVETDDGDSEDDETEDGEDEPEHL